LRRPLSRSPARVIGHLIRRIGGRSCDLGGGDREIRQMGGRTGGLAGGATRTVLVPDDTRRLSMARTSETLNQEWAEIVHSTAARRALMRWSAAHPVLLPATD